MKIKVCGMREPGNISDLKNLAPDYIGLIFYGMSKRFVEHLNPTIVNNLPSEIKLTGVFVDAELNDILQKASMYNLRAIQLHGNDSPQFCSELRAALKEQNPAIEIIKAFGVDESFDFAKLNGFETVIDFFLFDTKTSEHGGSGKKFDWNILQSYNLRKPYLLSGGIGLNDLQKLRQINDERFYGADLNSKFEIHPGLKNIPLVGRAIQYLREPLIK